MLGVASLRPRALLRKFERTIGSELHEGHACLLVTGGLGFIGSNLARRLVDLGAHTAFARLPVFAEKLAPLQLSYLGYPDRTGLASYDGRIVDAGYEGGCLMGATTVAVGPKQATFAAVAFDDLRQPVELTPTSARFVQTVGGHTALPAPRRKRP